MERVCVVGLGYIGLPTASLLATKGFNVIGVDINENTVNSINCGEIPIYEPDLDILVKAAVQSGRLIADTKPSQADVYIIAVPTPFQDNYVPDISYVESAARTISEFLTSGNLVILESTIPVGTTERVCDIIREMRSDINVPQRQPYGINTTMNGDKPVYIAHCPERVLPGQILRELVENDRIIGGINKDSSQRAKEFYQKFIKGMALTTDSRTAEMAKLTENAFRDVNIAFANELSLICDSLNISVWELVELANRHPRVNILNPGPGVGGHCIAVDPWFIVASVPEKARLIKTARQVNSEKPCYIATRVKEKVAKFVNPNITCLGLSYKANIDDLRESPAVEIVSHLARENVGTIFVVEPHIKKLPPELECFENVKHVDIVKGLELSDVLVLLVDHNGFKEIENEALKEKIVIDTRGIWR